MATDLAGLVEGGSGNPGPHPPSATVHRRDREGVVTPGVMDHGWAWPHCHGDTLTVWEGYATRVKSVRQYPEKDGAHPHVVMGRT